MVKDTGFVERALRHAAAFRSRQGYPFDHTIHHSDAGSQYTAIHYGETLMLEGLIGSIGTVGDALDNALCETTIGLYKTECLRPGSPSRTGPIRTLADLENMTSAWVSWYNTTRLMHRLGRIPPAEAEACAFRSGVERSDRGDASDHRFAGISYVMHRGCFAGTFRDACRRNDRAHRSGIRWWFRGCEIQRTPGQSSTQPTSRPQFPNEMHCAPGRASSQHRFCHVQALSFACPAGWTQGARRHAA